MQYKLLALDIDGTVTNSAKQITSATKETLRRAQQLGVKVVLASGRPADGLLPYAEELGLPRFGGYILAFNGAKIICCDGGGTVFEQTAAAAWARPLADAAREHGLHILSYTEDGHGVVSESAGNHYIQIESRLNHMPMHTVEDFGQAVSYPVNKFLMAGEPELVERAMPAVRALANGQLNVFRSEPYFLEIMPNGVDKANALGHLLETLGWARENLLACGDGYNDITMLRFAGMGVAMANAQDAAKEAADTTTCSNDEDGVARAVERFILDESAPARAR